LIVNLAQGVVVLRSPTVKKTADGGGHRVIPQTQQMLDVGVLVKPSREGEQVEAYNDARQDEQELVGGRVAFVLAAEGGPPLEAAPEINLIEEIVQRVEPAIVREVVGGKERMHFLEAFDHRRYLYHFYTGTSDAAKSENATFRMYLKAYSRTSTF
jgi:hypothetical protein